MAARADTMGAQVLTLGRSTEEPADFSAVFDEHHRGAVRLAYLLLSDADQAEDVVADAFVKVYRQWQRGRVRDASAYVHRAVVNEANSRLRRRYLERFWARRRVGDDRGPRPVDEQAAEADEVWSGLARLPDRQRAAIVLRYFEDLSEAETARTLGVSVGTVKSQVSRGLSRLEELLAAPAGATDHRGGDG